MPVSRDIIVVPGGSSRPLMVVPTMRKQVHRQAGEEQKDRQEIPQVWDEMDSVLDYQEEAADYEEGDDHPPSWGPPEASWLGTGILGVLAGSRSGWKFE